MGYGPRGVGWNRLISMLELWVGDSLGGRLENFVVRVFECSQGAGLF